jgi:transposase
MSQARWPRDLGKERLWRQRLQRWQRSGLSGRDFCQCEHLHESAFYFWKREIARRDREQAAPCATASKRRCRPRATAASTALFVPVTISPAPVQATILEVVVRAGRTIRVMPGFDAALLRAVVAALEAESC